MNTGLSTRQDGLFEDFFATDDPDLAIVHLDAVDEGAVGLL